MGQLLSSAPWVAKATGKNVGVILFSFTQPIDSNRKLVLHWIESITPNSPELPPFGSILLANFSLLAVSPILCVDFIPKLIRIQTKKKPLFCSTCPLGMIALNIAARYHMNTEECQRCVGLVLTFSLSGLQEAKSSHLLSRITTWVSCRNTVAMAHFA